MRLVMSLAALVLMVSLDMWAGSPVRPYLKKSDSWFKGEAGKQITENILSWQSVHGSWPKNMDSTETRYTGDREKLKGTFDNSATMSEMRFLAKAFDATKDVRCRDAFIKGLKHIFEAQYLTGGWPQYYPLSKNYHRHITFNDNSMVNILVFLREVATGKYALVDDAQRAVAQAAFDRGIECILKCQVRVDGKLTAWCAQHDAKDLSPRPARSYELVSLSGGESAGILGLLMSLRKPSPAVIASIDAAAAWYDAVKIMGLRETRVDGNKVMVKDAKAPVLWARFYEIGTNRPFFCGRDGVKKYDIAEIESERRNGYSWYGTWGKAVAREYAAWKLNLK